MEQLFKYINIKEKKRFGSSINRRSPGYFNKRLEFQVQKYGGIFINVNKFNYKASQYNHETEEATKCNLSDRTKLIDNHLVQRDLYSSFLLYHYKDTETIDFIECRKDFLNFLNKQNVLLKRLESSVTFHSDISYKNFGLNYFAI